MDYFMIKQSSTIVIPKVSKPEASRPETLKDEISVRTMDHISSLDRFDFISAESLISDRLKLLFEQYLPEQKWHPCVFIEPARKLQKTFWFLPPLPYQPQKIITASNGLPAAIYIDEQDFAEKSPGIFHIRSPKGTYTVIVHLSVAESILRRGICGLELIRLSDF